MINNASNAGFGSTNAAIPAMAGSNSTLPTANAGTSNGNANVVVSFDEFCTLVRHGKLKQLKEALANVPDRSFDPLNVANAFVNGRGTVYATSLEASAFHINKGDANGNSPLLLATQNNNIKVVQLLLAKGANVNHQNVRNPIFGYDLVTHVVV